MGRGCGWRTGTSTSPTGRRGPTGCGQGDDGPFTETARGGEQLSKVIDNFAEVNDMPSCATTHDV